MYGNTVKDGSGSFYHILQDSEGRLIFVPAFSTGLSSDTAANDSDKTFTVPASTEWRLLSIWVELTTTATVGDRQLVVQIQDGTTDVIAEFRAGVVQAASLTRNYLFAPGAVDLTSFRDTDYLSTPIPELILPAAYIIRVYDNNAVDAAADDMVAHVRRASRAI